jgi:hypothetical protein
MSEPHARKDDSMVAAVRWELRRIADATVDAANETRARGVNSTRTMISAPLSESQVVVSKRLAPRQRGEPRRLRPGRIWGSLVNGVASMRARIDRLLEAAHPDERTVWHLATPRRSRSHHSAHRR